MAKEQEVARSRALAAKVLYAAFQTLKENNRELPYKDVQLEVQKRVSFDDWALATYEKTGNIRWKALLNFFSVDAVKSGFLVKKQRVWYLTPEGETALGLGELGLLKAANEGYRNWRRQNPAPAANINLDTEIPSPDEESEEINLEEAKLQALEGIRRYISEKNPYEFQDLVAALLRGMGYYTPLVAPPGKDGGIDIMAYRDPLGTVSPRIKLQVKHRETSASVHEIRQLMGLMQKDGDVGIFVSSGGFTADAKATARSSHIHVELIDLDRFIELWLEFYGRLSDVDKKLLPLLPIYFVAPIS